MPLFRYHRGSLEESMKTIIEVNSLDDLKKKLSEEYGETNLTCDFYCFDKRINWDTYMIRSNGDIIGFSDGELK